MNMPTIARRLADQTWTDLPTWPTVLVPVGSIEQHGPHLPLDTDTAIACAVAEVVAGELDADDVLVAPAISYAASGEHQGFAGTSSIGQDALRHCLIELVRSMHTWAGRIVFVNGHGGNQHMLLAAVTQLQQEGHDIEAHPCVADGLDAHAGRAETSLMLHIRPTAVRLQAAVAGNRAPLKELMPALVSEGIAAVSRNGVLGDPAGASAAEGERLLDDMARRIVAEMTERVS